MRLSTVLLLSSMLCSSLHALDKQKRAQVLIERARSVMLAEEAGTPAYDAVYRYTFSNPATHSGTIVRAYRSLSRSLTVLTGPDYRETLLEAEGRILADRSDPRPPYLAMRAVQMVSLTLSPDFVKVVDIREKDISGRLAQCVQSGEQVRQEVCFDNATGVVLYDFDEYGGITYGEFASYSGKLVPKLRRVYELNPHTRGNPALKMVLEIELQRIGLPETDLDTFVLSSQAKIRPACKGTQPPKAISTPAPDHPLDGRGKHVVVVLRVEIDENGRVLSPEVVRSGGPSFDHQAQMTVQRWRFKPAMCKSQPVPVDFNIEVHFR